MTFPSNVNANGQRNQTRNIIELPTATLTEAIADSFIRTSFYLPADILVNKRWNINPIRVLTGKAFMVAYHQMIQAPRVPTIVTEPADLHLLFLAHHVGVSLRELKSTGEVVMIAKLWYGQAKEKS